MFDNVHVVRNQDKSLIVRLAGALRAFLGLAVLLVLLRGLPTPALAMEAGPLAHEFQLTLDVGQRSEYLGPLFYRERTEFTGTWALPPLMSNWYDEGTQSSEFDFLYPLFSRDAFGTERRWHFFQVISLSSGGSYTGAQKDRFTIFPFYFQQRSVDPADNYTAVVPFYGTIKNRLFRDEYYFILGPVYLQTRKRDVVTDNYLWPFFHLRRGDGLTGWQFWPFYSEEHKAVTVRENLIEEPNVVGGHSKEFILWPVYIRHFTGIGTENPEFQLSVFPFYYEQQSTYRDATTILWPFFGWLDEKKNDYREYRFPYPLIVWSEGEGETGWRVWPLYGDFYRRGARINYTLWPVYRASHLYDTDFERDRKRVLFIVYNDIKERNRATGDMSHKTYLWPLFLAERELDGRRRFQMLALLEPAFPVGKSIRRNWSPVWSVWRSESNPATGRSSESLLWNLYRTDRTDGSRKTSLLFGLVQYQSSPERRGWRLLYIPFGEKRPATTGQP